MSNLKLNLGAGNKRHEGFLNVDSYAGANPDYVVDLETQLLPFTDSSVSHVLCHHVLEHLGDGFFHCIREIYRVCAANAVVDVRVPHPKHDTFLIDPTHKRPILPDTMAMFSQARNLQDQEAGGSETPLGIMHRVDFEVTQVDYTLDPYFKRLFQRLTEAQCDNMVRTSNNVIQEIQLQLRVVK